MSQKFGRPRRAATAMVAKPTGYVVTAAHFDVYKIGPGIIYANVLVTR